MIKYQSFYDTDLIRKKEGWRWNVAVCVRVHVVMAEVGVRVYWEESRLETDAWNKSLIANRFLPSQQKAGHRVGWGH